MHHPDTFRIGAFLLSPGRRSLTLGEAEVPLGSRAFDLLLALIKRQGRLATKDELMAEVWSGTVVDENNLAAQISAVRKVLSADSTLARDLQTVPGRGYRLVAPIEPLNSEATPHGEPSRTRLWADEALSLVVLPFTSLSSDPEQAYFAEGLSQTVSTDLSRISGLLVISSATAATFKGPNPDIGRMSAELGVRFALAGSVQRIDRNVRINARLVDGQTGVQVWAELFDGDATDLFSLQDRITGRIANSIGREIFVAARDGLARNIDPKSLDFVMRGIAADNRPQSLQSLQEQEELFSRAVELDPNNSEALARLARAIVLQITQAHASGVIKAEALQRGVSAAEKAVTLDPGNPRGHYAMGLVHVLRGHFDRSALANEAAITLDRNFALAHNNLGNSLVHLGNGQDALEAVDVAIRLDPRGPQVGSSWTVKGFARLQMGDTDEAVKCFSRAIIENPRLPRAHAGSAIALAIGGNLPAARKATTDLLDLVPGYRLSQTIDACFSTSPTAYRRFYTGLLLPGAEMSGLPL